eukprot:gene406-439_t
MIQSNEETLISGYLYKRTRDGRWQKRWFETNGVYLTYYKSRKMEKLLAALSLPQVGEIKRVPPEQDSEHQEGLFSIELNSRIYILRAPSGQEAQHWVSVLNKVREDGIQASLSIQTPLSVPSTATSSETNPPDTVKGSRTEWIKSGKTCCC